MNPTLKKSINIGSWVLAVAAVFTLLGFASYEQQHVPFKKLDIKISTDEGNYFIQEDDIRTLVYDLGYRPTDKTITEVDVSLIEKMLRNNPSIKDADAYTCIDGCLKIEIKQRNPIMRVFNESGESYYIDEDGWLMPLSNKYTARVMIASGHLNEPYAMRYKVNMAAVENYHDSIIAKDNVIAQLYALASYVNNDPFWKAQINEVYVNEEGELELLPRVGSQRILIGTTEDLEEKFEKLMIFYKKGLSKTGWNEYSLINLKFKNQVVCSK